MANSVGETVRGLFASVYYIIKLCWALGRSCNPPPVPVLHAAFAKTALASLFLHSPTPTPTYVYYVYLCVWRIARVEVNTYVLRALLLLLLI